MFDPNQCGSLLKDIRICSLTAARSHVPEKCIRLIWTAHIRSHTHVNPLAKLCAQDPGTVALYQAVGGLAAIGDKRD
jgi:hypothetical protein